MSKQKDFGFPVMRGRGRPWGRFWRRLPWWFWPLALLALLWIIGETRAWPQNSGPSSSGSENDLKTWETLSGKFQMALSGQSERLRQVLTELETSKASSLKLTNLLEQSLQANGLLKSYNEQLAARMQTRDEELSSAYETMNRLEKQRLKLIIAVMALGIIAAAGIFLLVIKTRG
jgi:hypothetical protein